MNIPNNSLTEEIKEIVNLCEELKEDYGDDSSWFKPPATDEEIIALEVKHEIKIPESYKDWLRFTDSCQIRNLLARLFGVQEMRVNVEHYPEDYVIIGSIIGDGEDICFSKTTGEIICFSNEQIDEYNDFKVFLNNTIIRMLRKS